MTPGGNETSFESRMKVYASYNYVKANYTFRIERVNVTLNGKPPEKIVDQLMNRLGSTYYPIKLTVSPTGKIMQVDNFSEICQRWENECKTVLENEYSESVERYILLAKDNLKNRECLSTVLKRDTFMQLYFTDRGTENFWLSIYGIDGAGSCSHIKCKKSDENRSTIEYVGGESDAECYNFLFRYSKLNDLLLVKGKVEVIGYDGMRYIKKVSVKGDDKLRKAQKSNKFISLFAD